MFRFAAITAVLFGAVAACSGSSEEPNATIDVTDLHAAVHETLDRMNKLESYRMDMAFSPEGTDIPARVDFDEGKFFERITVDATSGGTVELIVTDSLYSRRCSGGSDCDQWTKSLTPTASAGKPVIMVPSLGGLTTVLPETLALNTVDLVPNWSVDETSGTVKLVGEIDLYKAITENQIRNAIAVGYTRTEAEKLFEFSNGPSPTNLVPSTIELELTSDGLLMKSVRIGVPGDNGDPYFVVTFSRFNDVSVEAPSDYTAAPY